MTDESQPEMMQAKFWDDRLKILRQEIGDVKMYEFQIKMAIKYESFLRENFPKNPLLDVLDRHRAPEAARGA